MPRAKKHIIEGMTSDNISYALNNNRGRSYVTRVNSEGTGARVYHKDTKVTPEHGGNYHIGDDVARIERHGDRFELLPGSKKPRYSTNKFLESFEKGLERSCREYNKEHHGKPASRKRHKNWGL